MVLGHSDRHPAEALDHRGEDGSFLSFRDGVKPLAERHCCDDQVVIALREYRAGLVVPPNVGSEARIELAVRGGYLEECDGRRRLARAGRCFFRPQGSNVRGCVSSEGLVELVVVFARSVPGGRRTEGHPSMVTLAANILSELLQGNAKPQELETLAARCLEVVQRTKHLEETRAPWIHAVIERLQDVSAGSPTLGDLADLAGVHRAHLTRTFRRESGTTPGQYRRLVILQEAATRLASTEHAIANIASELGFADQSHLGRHFARAFGLTPGRFRALMRHAQRVC